MNLSGPNQGAPRPGSPTNRPAAPQDQAAKPEPQPIKVGPGAVAKEVGGILYQYLFPGKIPQSPVTVEQGTYPLNIKHPQAKQLSNLKSGSQYLLKAYTEPTHSNNFGQAYIEKVRPKDGKPAYDVIAIAGSNDLGDWRRNANVIPRQTEEFGVMHSGFHDTYEGLKPMLQKEMDPQVPSMIFGHSLGGAVAAQLGVAMKGQGYDIRTAGSVGAPPPGAQEFADKVREIPGAHVRNRNDPVGGLPYYTALPGINLDRTGNDGPHAGSILTNPLGMMDHSVLRYGESIGNHLERNPEVTPPPTRPSSPAPDAGTSDRAAST